MPLAIDIVQQGPISNAGLALTRLAPALKSRGWSEHLGRIASASGNVASGYQSYFDRVRARTAAGPANRAVLLGRSLSPSVCGMGERTPGENGLTLHPVYGVPYIPGTSLKGILRSWVLSQAWGPDWREGGPQFTALFGAGGHEGAAGILDILDALPDPSLANGEAHLTVDVLTPHFAPYYQGARPGASAPAPTGWDGPNPVPFLVASFDLEYRIVLEGQAEWVRKAAEWLVLALRERGVGAKSRAGYGRFKCSHVGAEDRNEVAARGRSADARSTIAERLATRLRGYGADPIRAEAERWALSEATSNAALRGEFAAPQIAGVLRLLDEEWGFRDAWLARASNARADEAKRSRARLIVTAWDARIAPAPSTVAPAARSVAVPTPSSAVAAATSTTPFGTATWNPPNMKRGKEQEARQNAVKRLVSIAGRPDALTGDGVQSALAWLRENGAPEGQIRLVRRAYKLDEA